MSGGSQVHIFWGAPASPLEMTVSQKTTLMSTADPWKTIQLWYNQHSLHLKDKNHEPNNLKDYQVSEAITGPPDLLSGCCLVNSVSRSVQVKDDFTYFTSETQNIKSQKIYPSGLSDVTNSNVQIHGFKGTVQHLPEEKKNQKVQCENNKITDEEPKNQSNLCQNFQTNSFRLDHKCAVILDLVGSTKQINTDLEAVETKYKPTEHHEMQNQCLDFFSSNAVDEPRSDRAVRNVSKLKISTDTEFLSIMISSQVAFLAQREDRALNSINKGTISMETEPKASHGEIRITEDSFIQPNDDFAEGHERGQNEETYSLELFSPICPEKKSSHIHINPEKDVEENIGSQELFSSEDKLSPNEICIELCRSGTQCSQLNTFHKSAVKRNWSSEDKSGHSKALSKVLQVSKKMKLGSNARDSIIAMSQRNVSEFKGIKKISLIKNCDSKSQKYNCLAMVLTPSQMKEINIKSGPNSGSKVPLATIIVIDQSEIKKKVFLWRTAAFWALTVFLGDIILLTDVVIHEDQWIGEIILQSTFTSQLLNLGNYSSVQPKEYSNIVSDVALQDLLAYVSSKHFYLEDLPQRQPQKVNSIEFVELERLQPDRLVHAVLRVVDITILTESLYTYRGQKQRKVMLTVEQAQGQHYVLVLWGLGAAWYPQLQRKKDYIWEFKYLLVQHNCILETLELHTTPWSSCECLFDDDIRAITFKTKFQNSVPTFVKMSDLEAHLKDKYSGVVLIKAQILELVFPVAAAQKITLNAHSSLKSIFSSLPNIIYTGCAKCGLELETDENKIYRQCLSCLPFARKKTHYRPALMTVADGTHNICIHVASELIEKILLNISPDCLNRIVVPSSEITYGMVAADLLLSLLTDSTEPCVLKIQSLFVLDENSYPLQQDFSLLDFCPDQCKAWSPSLRPHEEVVDIPKKKY
ncbi:shieldin complex subunit 2 isoform X1 [Marmota monax]|uniref:shieldin complex subunit 2 isoform X1 n=1 Tax=Marmota monax TaxID=9995 RepID=UPI001EB052D6|nr:shieldin complex subunit 2 isoform X1 [Marmota monax]XP_046305859.1 shieldin complex subunit 2 isoform X1 [Marmota monax]XP_058437037.1 shieldin complex subunit 2 isoform X1 [Marmota monax]XP_058437038.1 shieldin complex subunit 2 isoform X1 [Marmota monax]XP_058437039.1 shieldin complex subunit 2 isoform X1 [Marmota monax]XP_058437040.1 shieldin complex subunit 2 isoform X1 [Marmota monax]XP_058437041.1 shieldin complex subunit 2 isoform X1 [Marmota monax]XP_058437042.1 shieldin complex 